MPLAEVVPFIERLRATGLEAVIYSTHSHRSRQEKCGGKEDAHLRVVLPFTQPVPVALWPRVWAAVTGLYVPTADRQAKDAKRMYYAHSYPASHAEVAIFEHLNPEVGHVA